MSQEKSLRKSIREMVKAELNEESLIGKWFRKLAKNVEDREFDRLMQTRDPGIRKRLAKMNDKIEKDIEAEMGDILAQYKKSLEN